MPLMLTSLRWAREHDTRHLGSPKERWHGRGSKLEVGHSPDPMFGAPAHLSDIWPGTRVRVACIAPALTHAHELECSRARVCECLGCPSTHTHEGVPPGGRMAGRPRRASAEADRPCKKPYKYPQPALFVDSE